MWGEAASITRLIFEYNEFHIECAFFLLLHSTAFRFSYEPLFVARTLVVPTMVRRPLVAPLQSQKTAPLSKVLAHNNTRVPFTTNGINSAGLAGLFFRKRRTSKREDCDRSPLAIKASHTGQLPVRRRCFGFSPDVDVHNEPVVWSACRTMNRFQRGGLSMFSTEPISLVDYSCQSLLMVRV
jgi:hypothetical protein